MKYLRAAPQKPTDLSRPEYTPMLDPELLPDGGPFTVEASGGLATIKLGSSFEYKVSLGGDRVRSLTFRR